MPPPLDLTGRRFGALTVIERAGRVKYGSMQTGWLCRCDCGAEIVVPQNRLPHAPHITGTRAITACPACRTKPCVVCGNPMPISSHSNTCSEACHAARRREHYNQHYHLTLQGRNAQTMQAVQRRRQQLAALTPEQKRERERALARARHARHAFEVQRRRREQFAALAPETQAAIRAERREYGRLHAARRRAARALAGLAGITDQLTRKLSDDDNDDT